MAGGVPTKRHVVLEAWVRLAPRTKTAVPPSVGPALGESDSGTAGGYGRISSRPGRSGCAAIDVSSCVSSDPGSTGAASSAS